MSNLTALQESLIDGLRKEFTRINPKVTNNSTVKRFTLNTIDECKNEEAKFYDTIRKHNDTMIKVFDKQFKDELKSFNKEFGKLFTTEMGHIPFGSNSGISHGYEAFINGNKTKEVTNNLEYYEVYLYIVSKTKTYSYDSRRNYFNGKSYTKLNVDFKRERVGMILESGKEVYGYKIVGLLFCSREYLNRRDGLITSTLDEYVQTSKDLQKTLVALSV
jgi:hypothetical protein